MTFNSDDFLKIQFYFEKLMDLSEENLTKELNIIASKKQLSDEQFNHLIELLKADKMDSLPEKINTQQLDSFSSDSSQEQFNEEAQIGNYKINKQIGLGGMGKVFLAERCDGQFNQKVAIKVAHYTVDQISRHRFENERQILAKLTHPNIAHLLSGGTTKSGQPYLVMEYVDGQTIDTYCNNNNTTLNERISILIQTCTAVSFAHSNLILHRDLKPDNILITSEGVVKLLDFGIAKLIDEDHYKNTATQVMTKKYASPEQILGQPVSTQSDVFSMGVIAYELITGYHPFPHDSSLEREQNVVSGRVLKVKDRITAGDATYPSLSDIPDRYIKGDLENILHKALSTDPKRRYDSIDTFKKDLDSYLKNKPVKARKSSSTYLFKKWVQRHKALSLVLILLIATLLSATIFSVRKSNETLQQKKIAIEQKLEAEKLKLIAEAETVRSNKIADFLQNIFTNAKPHKNKQELTAKDLLFQGLESVQTELLEDPENRYKITGTLIEVLINLSEYDLAFQSIQKNYQNCIKELSKYNTQCQMMLIHKANLYHNTDKPQKSVSILNQSLDIAKSENPQNKKFIGSLLRKKFYSLVNLNKLEEALKSTEEGIKYLQTVGISDEETYSSYNDLAFLAIKYKKFDQADDYFTKMNNILQNQEEDNYLEIGKLENMRGFSFLMQKKYLKAAQYRENAVQILTSNFDQPFEVLGLIQYTLSQTWIKAGNSQMAIKRATDALSTYSAISDNSHPKRQNLFLHIANIYFEIGLIEKAKNYLDQVEIDQLNDRLCDLPKAHVFLANYSKDMDQARNKLDQFKTCSNNNTYNNDKDIFIPVFEYHLALIEDNLEQQQQNYSKAISFWQKNPSEYATLKVFFHSLRK